MHTYKQLCNLINAHVVVEGAFLQTKTIQGMLIIQKEYRMQRQVTTYRRVQHFPHVFILGSTKAMQCTVPTTGSQYTTSIRQIPSISFSCTKLFAIKLLTNTFYRGQLNVRQLIRTTRVSYIMSTKQGTNQVYHNAGPPFSCKCLKWSNVGGFMEWR